MKTSFLLLMVTAFFSWSCGGGAKQRAEAPETSNSMIMEQKEVHGSKVKEVRLGNPLDKAMIDEGEKIYDMKCAACHRLTEERLVGPGWAGVSQKRDPVWIINMITNVDMMLAEDEEAQKLLEQCLVRMPNQNINEKEARSILEFMRKNDGEK